MAKVYAVKQGRQTGIFDTWAECQEQIKGFSGAVYKSFTSREDAEKYLGIGDRLTQNYLFEQPELSEPVQKSSDFREALCNVNTLWAVACQIQYSCSKMYKYIQLDGSIEGNTQ